MSAHVIRFPIERTRGSVANDVRSMLDHVWRRRFVLSAPDWVFVVGRVIDGNVSQHDHRRLSQIVATASGSSR